MSLKYLFKSLLIHLIVIICFLYNQHNIKYTEGFKGLRKHQVKYWSCHTTLWGNCHGIKWAPIYRYLLNRMTMKWLIRRLHNKCLKNGFVLRQCIFFALHFCITFKEFFYSIFWIKQWNKIFKMNLCKIFAQLCICMKLINLIFITIRGNWFVDMFNLTHYRYSTKFHYMYFWEKDKMNNIYGRNMYLF